MDAGGSQRILSFRRWIVSAGGDREERNEWRMRGQRWMRVRVRANPKNPQNVKCL